MNTKIVIYKGSHQLKTIAIMGQKLIQLYKYIKNK